MANAIYSKYKTALMTAAANSDLDSAEGATGVYVALIDTGIYTFDDAHEFFSDLSGVVGTDQEITTKTVGVVAQGVFDGDDLVFPSVAGNSIEAVVVYRRNAGASTTWRLIAYIDTGVTGLPLTPVGVDVNLAWNATGVFKL